MLSLLKVTLDNTKNITYIIIYKIQEIIMKNKWMRMKYLETVIIPKIPNNDTTMFHKVLDT